MRTDQQILEQTNELAHIFADLDGFVHKPMNKDKYLYYSNDERAKKYWEMARMAQLKLTYTDPNDII